MKLLTVKFFVEKILKKTLEYPDVFWRMKKNHFLEKKNIKNAGCGRGAESSIRGSTWTVQRKKRVQSFRQKLKAYIEKFANETTDPLFEISVNYNYKGGDYFMSSKITFG